MFQVDLLFYHHNMSLQLQLQFLPKSQIMVAVFLVYHFLCFYFLKTIYLFGCIGSQLWHTESFIVACGLLFVARAPECMGLVVVVCGLSSRSLLIQLLHSIWDLPGQGIEPVSPALAGRFFTTEPQGMPINELKKKIQQSLSVYLVCLFNNDHGLFQM